MQALYNFLWRLLTPIIHIMIQRRVRRGKEDAARLGERFGNASVPRPAGKLIWVHAASVGEALSVLGVVQRLLTYDATLHVLLTTGTVASAKMMARRLADFNGRAMHQYFPLDDARYVQKFHDHWRVDGVVWLESELWPAHLAALKKRAIPAVWLNARLSAASVRRWLWFGSWIKNLVAPFMFIAAQTAADAARVQQLGGGAPALLGNLKFTTALPTADSAKQAEIAAFINGRPVWLFASIHPGEEQIAARVHAKLKTEYPHLLTIIVPRHPPRAAAFAAVFAAKNLTVAQRSVGQTVLPHTDIYLADTMGELLQFYSVVKLVVMGGSFVPHGGQNPIEPARLGCAVLYGPHMFNFTAITAAFGQSAAALAVQNEADLTAQLHYLLAYAADVQMFGARAAAVCAHEAASEEKIWAALQPWHKKIGLAV